MKAKGRGQDGAVEKQIKEQKYISNPACRYSSLT